MSSKKADALAALKEAKIEEVEGAIAKLNANLDNGEAGMITVTNPKTKAQTRRAMKNTERAKKQEQRDKLAVKLAQLQGLAPKASRARPSKRAQMNANIASGTLYCYKATPEGKRGGELDGALIGDDYVSANDLKTRWGKTAAVKPTASRAPSRASSAATTRASSPTGGPGHEGGARRRRRTMRRKASRKARKGSRKASRKARKSMRRSRKH